MQKAPRHRALRAVLAGIAVLAFAPARADEPLPSIPDTCPAPVISSGDSEETCPIAPAPSLGGPYLTGEYLLVRPHRDGLDVGVLAPNSPGGLVGGTVESQSWTPASGFRIGGGYRLADDWDVGLFYAYFHAPHQHTFDAPDGSVLQPTLGLPGALGPVSSADSDNDLDYNVLDLEVGKWLGSGSAGFRLFGGGRLASINQAFKCIYSGGTLGDLSDYINNPTRFQGAGFTAGAEGAWKFYGNWGLYGLARVSLLSGQSNGSISEVLGGATTLVSVSQKYELIVPVVEMGGGLGYQGEQFFLRAGYDLSNWFGVANTFDFSGGASPAFLGHRRGDLSFDMLSLKFGYRF